MAGSQILQRSKYSMAIAAVIASVIFFVYFWNEWTLVFDVLAAWVFVLIFRREGIVTVSPEASRAFLIIETNIFIFLLGFSLTLYWVAQFTLPVRDSAERMNAFISLLRYTLTPWLYGPAIFVKEGMPKAGANEMESPKAGAALVDLYSAIVVEQQSGSIDAVRQEVHFESLTEEPEKKPYKPSLWKKILIRLGLARDEVNVTIVKAFGPGVVFTKAGEKIVGWVDLRKQARSQAGVQAATRDGIDITTSVNVGFTLGQPEEILQITKTEEGWRVIQFAVPSAEELAANPDLPPDVQVIKLPPDHLSEDDAQEADQVFSVGEFEWLEDGSKPHSGSGVQFVFDAERVFSAVYSRARHVSKNEVLGEWTDLPTYVATEVFRGMLAHEDYDDLYKPDHPTDFPLNEFKGKFGRIVRNMGILGYQIVMRKDGTLMKELQVWDETELKFSVSMKFKSAAVLRDRGIKVLNAGFSDLVPANEVVRAQLLENWRAHWQQETQKTIADHELQTIRIHNHERSRTQQDMIYSLSRIFQDGNYTEEALALRLYQALEAAAINPATQRLLPSDTVQMLSNLRQWLLPENKKTNDANPEANDADMSA